MRLRGLQSKGCSSHSPIFELMRKDFECDDFVVPIVLCIILVLFLVVVKLTRVSQTVQHFFGLIGFGTGQIGLETSQVHGLYL